MIYSFGKNVVIGLGGSIVYPDGIDVDFLTKFRVFLKQEIKKGRKFVIVIGGGRVARVYQEAASKIVKVTDEDKDWLGIHATRCNAHLLRTIFRDIADPVVFDARHKRKKLKYPVTIASGWRPGWSTDYVAAQIAIDLKIPEVIIWGKPEYVFDRDPMKFSEAKPYSEISWKAYRKIIPAKWSPGAHAPVDPIAAKTAASKRLRCIVVGRDFENCRNLLAGREFEGTVITNG